jgi:DNA-binding NtrC family response regulator
MPDILIADDDRDTCQFIAELLASPDRRVVFESDPAEAIRRVTEDRFDAVVSDINLNAPQTGLDVLRAARRRNPRCQVVLISGFGTLETAVEAVRAGAFDYISKPFNISQVKSVVDRALTQALAPERDEPRGEVSAAVGLIGRTAPMLDVYKQIALAADAAAPVLIIGESGTGKELVAKAIHAHGRRASKAFVAVNCGAITETLLESELFGHARGSFTGAVADAKGLFEQAHGGTIFLDEIGETSPALQVKLLRTIEESEVRPVGAARPVKIDVRVVAATNAELERAVAEGRFRQDLYYRLNVVSLTMPPLRERCEDILPLANYFAAKHSRKCNRHFRGITKEAQSLMSSYSWPGNVRELENALERAIVLGSSEWILPDDLPESLLETELPAGVSGTGFHEAVREAKKRIILMALEQADGNYTEAARSLGIHPNNLHRLIRNIGMKSDAKK